MAERHFIISSSKLISDIKDIAKKLKSFSSRLPTVYSIDDNQIAHYFRERIRFRWHFRRTREALFVNVDSHLYACGLWDND